MQLSIKPYMTYLSPFRNSSMMPKKKEEIEAEMIVADRERVVAEMARVHAAEEKRRLQRAVDELAKAIAEDKVEEKAIDECLRKLVAGCC